MDAPLNPVDRTKPKMNARKRTWKVRLSAAVDAPTTTRLTRITLRALKRSKKCPRERLGDSVDQPSDSSHHRNRRSVPLELFTHWDDENAKAIACARGNESDEHRSAQDVPSIVDPGRFRLVFRHIPLILQRQTAEYGIWRFLSDYERAIAVDACRNVARFKFPMRNTRPDKLSL